MSRLQSVSLMILVNLLWSMAGVITRHINSASIFEITFWRSAISALALAVALTVLRGPDLWRKLVHAPMIIWISGLCWSIMFTAFMVAITLTTVANVLIIMALNPLITAIFTRLFLKHRLPATTWMAIVTAVLGILWMFLHNEDATFSITGSLVSAGVPLAAAVNFTILQLIGINSESGKTPAIGKPQPDMLQAVLIGAILSALATLPLAFPFQASSHDLVLLSFLGVFQLCTPCLLVVRLTRELSAPEISLLGQLEVIFGVTWAWLWAGEKLSSDTIFGGSLVLGALVVNELVRMYRRYRARKMVNVNS